MIIKKIAVGNSEESYIEDSLTKDFNIISSDDNNKGKTIIIQSLMYALGNEPTFPSSFSYKNYFYYVEFEYQLKNYIICRKQDGFVLRTPSKLQIFDNVSELKRFWNKNIFKLPEIYKNGLLRVVDPLLYLQLFFIGQDKKATYNISNPGYYNKKDFLNMLFDFCNLGTQQKSLEEVAHAQRRILDLKEEKKTLLKQNKILNSNKTAVSYLSSISDMNVFDTKVKSIESISNRMTELKKQRNLSYTRKAHWDSTLKELRSLNRTLEVGELRCMDCGSGNISFSTAQKESFNFDVSSVSMRNEIIDSINDKIEAYNEEIQKLTSEIISEQELLQNVLSDNDISLETIVAYKEEISRSSNAEDKIRDIESKISDLEDQISSSDKESKNKKEEQDSLIYSISSLIRETYFTIDPSSNAIIEGLFTKQDKVLSGSEATVFHIAKLYALQKCTEHSFPIIIDSFRAEDLSTSKEKIVLDLFNEIENQKIFTTTLKEEELDKYKNITFVNDVDYTSHKPSKMLGEEHNTEFQKLLSNLSINFN